jgi:hypothetical protein
MVSGTHVRLFYPPAQAPCGGTLAFLDGTLSRQADALGLPLPGPIDYHYRPLGTPFPCASGSTGCTDEVTGQIWAQAPDFTHELVHALLGINGLNPVSFFDEGACVALGGPDDADGPIDYSTPLDPLLAADQLDFADFPTAGDLCSYLLTVDGAASFVELLRKAPLDSSAAAVRQAFAAAYGQSLDSAIAMRRASPLTFGASRMAVPECGIDPVPWTGQARVTAALDCTNGVGPTFDSEPPQVRTWATFEVPSDGFYQVTNAADSGFASLSRCEGNSTIAELLYEHHLSGAAPLLLAGLGAGRAYVRFEAYQDSPANFDLTIAPTLAATADCVAPPPLDLDPATDAVYFAPSPGQTMTAALRSSTALTATVAQTPLASCSNACASTGCTDLSIGQPVDLAAGQAYVFRTAGSGVAAAAGLRLR